jgi:hypothetical protein
VACAIAFGGVLTGSAIAKEADIVVTNINIFGPPSGAREETDAANAATMGSTKLAVAVLDIKVAITTVTKVAAIMIR